MSDRQSPRRWSWVKWIGREAAMVAGAFLLALVATAISAFSLALIFGPGDPRPEPWANVIFYVVFLTLLCASIVRDVRRARRGRAGGVS